MLTKKSASVETITTGSEFRRLSTEANAIREENENLEIVILRDLIRKAEATAPPRQAL